MRNKELVKNRVLTHGNLSDDRHVPSQSFGQQRNFEVMGTIIRIIQILQIIWLVIHKLIITHINIIIIKIIRIRY